MNSSTDDLRAVLTERAELAPDVTPLLAAAHDGARRRKQRHRTTAAVGVTVGVLAVAGVAVGTLRGGTEDRTAAAATTTVATTPAAPAAKYYTTPPLPFTVTAPAGYQPGTWVSDPAKSMLWFDQGTAHPDAFDVLYSTRQPGISHTAPVTVNGKPGRIGVLTSMLPGDRAVLWQIDSGHWAFVVADAKNVSDDALRTIAGSMTTVPSTPPVHLKLPVVAGWELASWNFGGDAGGATTPELASVCPNGTDLSGDYDDVGMPDACVNVDTWTRDPRQLPPGMPTPPADPTHTVVVRQLGPQLWLRVTGRNADAAVVKQLAAGATPAG